jgi:homoserine O-acetyltransferase
MSTKILLIALVCLANKLNAQQVPKTVSLGNFKTVSGKEIKNCIIGYSTLGKLNVQKNNVVLCPTWYAGKSQEISSEIVPLLMDTAGLYIIVADAFGNGISSSPSNNSSFPEITIRDLVNSQYELLTKYLHISHLKILMGVSMGGMQVMEWLISYPGFADNAISIAGSPKLSSYDLTFWTTEAALFSMPAKDQKSNELSLRMASNVFLLNKYTPSYWLNRIKQENVDSIVLADQADLLKKSMKPEDCLCQVKAILTQDIYKNSGKAIADMKQEITARTLIVVSKSDYIVNPKSSVDLAKAIGATLLELDNDCGHLGVICDIALVKGTVNNFLRPYPRFK